jgi:hypothetical protein
MQRWKSLAMHILRAPALNNPCKHDLLRVVGNKRAKFIDYTTEMAIRAPTNSWLHHCRLEALKDGCK